ncbi:AAA family ATPase [Streptomyces sp. DH10]|uniref:AAA family ATPase n=1 Tax=Streptomyces sp. DH10 TaxID=3040121 RepID=UPI002441E454|nr:AAA family ATPase [Streptomyces sp. DH10]MDG9713006.1 AAA family ATPase [Streptomyces sp. DH10]
MAEIRDLTAEIHDVREWIKSAGQALLTLEYKDHPKFPGFIRSEDIDSPSEAGAARGRQPLLLMARRGARKSEPAKTSTHRSFAALIDFLRFLTEEGKKENQPEKWEEEARALAKRLIKGYYDEIDPGDMKRYRGDVPSTFRDSHLLLALARLKMARSLLGLESADDERLKKVIHKLSAAISDDVHRSRFNIDEQSRHLFHDYITLFAVRAADTIRSTYRVEPIAVEITDHYPNLAKIVHRDILAQLGAYYAQDVSRFDPAELAFRMCLLHRLDEHAFAQIGGPALRVIKEAQSLNGSWPTARRVFLQNHQINGRGGELHVGSNDIALALSAILCGEINRGQDENVPLLLDVLHSAFLNAKASVCDLGHRKGWSSDRTRPRDHVESWTTAVVLSFFDRYHTALRRLRQREILGKYPSVTYAKADDFHWPDLTPSIRSAPEDEGTFEVRDPTASRKLNEKINEKFLAPVKNSPVRRPENISLLLSGPPGTGKTSLVEKMAESLNWPLLTLSPPDFLQGGLEKFEVSSAKIFDDLQKLRRVVVLFDECEDFFLRRDTENTRAVSERTIGAFITAGMLPRLVRLREQGWLIFVLSTNIAIDQLDPAVIRPGRFDFEQFLPHPSQEAQEEYIRAQRLDGEPATRLRDVLRKCTGDQPISFRILDELIAFLKYNNRASEDELESQIRRRMSPGPPRLENS